MTDNNNNESKKVYIVSGYGYTPSKAFKYYFLAKEEADRVNYNLGCSGSYNTVSVQELELIEK